MALTTRFIVHGLCPVSEPFSITEATRQLNPYADRQQTSFMAECSNWRLELLHQSNGSWRQNGSLLGASWCSCDSTGHSWYRKWSIWNTGWFVRPPAENSCHRSRVSDGTSHASVCERLDSVARTRSGSAAGEALSPRIAVLLGEPGTSARATSCKGAVNCCTCSELQRQALLHLLGPSTSSRHLTGRPLITHAAADIAAMLSPSSQQAADEIFVTPISQANVKQHHAGSKQCGISESAREPEASSVVVLKRSSSAPAELHAACLASVAAALVHLPRVGGEHGLALPCVFPQSWIPVMPPSPCATKTQPPQPYQLGQQQWQQNQACVTSPTIAGQAIQRGADAPIILPKSCQNPGREQPFVSSEGHYLATECGATSLGPASTEASKGLLYTIGRKDSSCSSTASGSDCRGLDPAEKVVWQQPGKMGSERSTALPQVEHESTSAQEGQQAVCRKGGDEQAERPKVFGNPIRYCKLLFAGAMSAVVSRTCVAPLERVKMDLLLKNGTGDAFTTAAQVLRTEGIAGFWKGNALNVLRTAPFKAVNFFSFDMYRAAFLALSGREENFERFLAGACAGVTATLVCFPLDVVRTRLMASVAGPRYGSGPFSTLTGILRNEGAAALYSGCLPAVIGMAPAGAVFYGVYDLLKHRHLESLAAANGGGGVDPAAAASTAGMPSKVTVSQQLTLDPLYTLMYGAMAGAASELIVYPLEVIRRKMQLQSMALANMRQVGGMHPQHHHHHHFGSAGGAPSAVGATGGRLAAAAHHYYNKLPYHIGAQQMIATLSAAAVANSPGLARVAAAIMAILSTDGPRGFYSGLLPNMLQVLPSAALSYYTYDTLKTVMGAR